jgi:hypothetical protein
MCFFIGHGAAYYIVNKARCEMRRVIPLLLIGLLIFVACEGPVGPQGAQGEQGSGERIVRDFGPVTKSPQMFYIGAITLDDMPLVSVYAATPSYPNVWFELPQWVEGMSGDGMSAFIGEGAIGVENCIGMWIRVVIVT